MKNTLALLLILTLGFGAVFFLSRHLEKIQPQPDETLKDSDLYFSADQLKTAGADFRGLIADWYWINSLQYLGGKLLNSREQVNINDLRPLNPRLLYPMLDRAATLDPQFTAVYSYGAAILPAIDEEQAIKLLEKGIAANPEDWRLHQNLGYIYWQSKNYAKAAEAYERGSRIAGAPVWMRGMSANMQARGGSRELAREIYKQMFDAAEDEQTKNFALLRFQHVQALDELDAIRSGLKIFQEKHDRCPRSWGEVYPILSKTVPPYGDALRLNRNGEMVDPSGAPYVLKSDDCTVVLNPASQIPQD